MRRCRLSLWAGICLFVSFAHGQNLVPNPSFETGTSQPASWTLVNPGDGIWETFGGTGGRSISVSNNGTACVRRWQTASVPVQPGLPYVFRFWGMATNVLNPNSRTCVTGFDVVTRDLQLTPQWSPYSYITVIPNNAVNPILRLGHCQVNGKLIFDDVEVLPVSPLHTLVLGQQLGTGEGFTPGKYSFKTAMAGFNANYARSLLEHTAVFASDGWAVITGQHVTYRHHLSGLSLTNAQIKLNFRYQQGDLIVETSNDGQAWQTAGQYTAPASGYISGVFNLTVASNSFPAETLYVRLRTLGQFIINQYEINADVPEVDITATGNTWFFERQNAGSDVEPVGVEETPGGFLMALELRNSASTNREFSLLSQVTGSAGVRERLTTSSVPPETTNTVFLELPSAGAGVNIANIEVRDTDTDTVLLTGGITINITWFRDSSYGYQLPGPTNCPVWWCEATYKVNRDRFSPAPTNDAVSISAARNEYEPFQLVLRPETTLSNITVSISDFALFDGVGASIAATNVEICFVEYVAVTESWGVGEELGDYPDPLLPLTAPFDAFPNTNQPLWFTVYVPKETLAGNYQATVTVQSDTTSFAIPVRLRVFDFTLSDVTHTKTAYGLEFNNEWQQLEDLTQKRAMWDLYMQNFRKHRISPFRPQTYDRITFSVTNDPVTVDFAEFDAAMERYLDEFDFNCFNWDEERYSGTFRMAGHERFTPEYRERYAKLMPLITAHLREKGWFDKAYSFWFDEPLPKHYPLVREGMDLVEQVAPGLRRMLTIFPDPPLYDSVEIWAPIFIISTFTSTYQRWVERQFMGEEIWWYVASYPFTPLPNNFTEQPALHPRIRAWMAEKYGVSGEIYWQAAWPYSEGFVPWNPWASTMSYSGNGGPWGNGNGLLLYPPTKTLPEGPVIAGPVNSLRWELLREGLEDREYFWLLKEMLHRGKFRLGPNHPAVLEGYAAQEAALALITSPLIYDQNPQSLHQMRLRLADAIAALDEGAPIMVRDPKTQAVKTNQTVILRAEAIGWPLPFYQWTQNGNPLVGMTGPTLTLSNVSASQLGDYSVIASNATAVVTSAVARISGYWEMTPQILTQPKSIVRKAGGSAVFAVTAVSANPLSYIWHFNSAPLPGATNTTLLLTNLMVTQAGDYQVIVSNDFGAVTSLVASLTVPFLQTNYSLIAPGAVWNYHDLGLDLGIGWRTTNYNDSDWSSGPAQLGFGDGDEQTIVSYGSDPNNKHITTYFRRAFVNPFTNAPLYLVARLLRDDGAVAYLNGTEVYRSQNMPNGNITYNSLASGFWESTEVTGANESTYYSQPVLVTPLKPGTNIFAVEVHQYTNNSDDLSFDMELVGTWIQPPLILSHPTNASQRVGQSVSFQVSAASAVPLAYQWLSNGIPINAATNAHLVLGQLAVAAVAEYSVVVSNSAGAVTSMAANLTVVPLPEVQGNWAANGAAFEVSLPADPAALTVLASTNLTEWTELFTLPPNAGPVVFADTNITAHPYRFYRLRADP